MGSMSYCLFSNMLGDLSECRDRLTSNDLSAVEHRARGELIQLCREIIATADEEGIE